MAGKNQCPEQPFFSPSTGRGLGRKGFKHSCPQLLSGLSARRPLGDCVVEACRGAGQGFRPARELDRRAEVERRQQGQLRPARSPTSEPGQPSHRAPGREEPSDEARSRAQGSLTGAPCQAGQRAGGGGPKAAGRSCSQAGPGTARASREEEGRAPGPGAGLGQSSHGVMEHFKKEKEEAAPHSPTDRSDEEEVALIRRKPYQDCPLLPHTEALVEFPVDCLRFCIHCQLPMFIGTCALDMGA